MTMARVGGERGIVNLKMRMVMIRHTILPVIFLAPRKMWRMMTAISIVW
jgi:hypothetical protein